MTRTAAVALLAALLGASAGAQDVRFRDKVDVESVVVDARVVDGAGRPLPGLTSADFRLKVDGHETALASVTWVAEDGGSETDAPDKGAEGEDVPRGGRLLVFFFQKDLESSRVMGFLQMLRRARELLDTLGDEDRVAVVSFDSHLRVWSDFTADRARLRHVLDRSILFERGSGFDPAGDPSLVAHLDPGAALRAASPETALLLLGEALGEVRGAKSLVLFGWGMGRWSPGVGVFLDTDYRPARRALVAARVTVFALDITNADAHTLEVGLEAVAEDTGGFYAKTHLFPGQALARLRGALAGHYVLTFAKPDLPRGEHAIDVALVGRKGVVLARPSYEG